MPFAEINGTRLHYEDTGDLSKPVVLLSHGFLMSIKVFAKQIDALRKNYRVIAYDQRAHGFSSVTSTGFDMDTSATDLMALVDCLDLKSVHLVAANTAGYAALRVAVRRPEILQSLTLISTSSYAERRIWSYRILGFVAYHFGIGRVVENVLSIVLGNKTLHQDVVDSMRSQILANSREGVAGALTGLVSRQAVPRENLETIPVKTLILAGDSDKALPLSDSLVLHKSIPYSDFKIIQECGHTPMVEQPDCLNEAILGFLAQF